MKTDVQNKLREAESFQNRTTKKNGRNLSSEYRPNDSKCFALFHSTISFGL